MAMNKTMAPIAIDSVPVNKIRKFVDFLSVNIPTAPERASAINIIPFSHADDVWKIFASKEGISDRKKPLTIQSAMLIGLILNKALLSVAEWPYWVLMKQVHRIFFVRSLE